jgi:hypothetical protein
VASTPCISRRAGMEGLLSLSENRASRPRFSVDASFCETKGLRSLACTGNEWLEEAEVVSDKVQ